MRRWFALVLLIWAAPLAAQVEDDRGFIVSLIEDAVSDLGRDVRLEGFAGALSSQATVDAITVADETGIWLRLEDVTLQWDRTALLSGEIDIGSLEAAKIQLLRMPVAPDTGPNLPSAEATPFALPELPVSVQIADISAPQIELAEAFLGEPMVAQFTGALSLNEGVGSANLAFERTDGKIGRFVLDTNYSNSTRNLDLSLLAEEGPNGIAARLLNIPDRPSASLSIDGSAPIDAFEAALTLSTDGQPRVTGALQLSSADTGQSALTERAFDLSLSGDVRPLLRTDYATFFGANSVLRLVGARQGDGAISLSNLIVATDQVTLRGSARFSAEGWPDNFDLRGRLGMASGDPVLLPLSGVPTYVRAMTLDAQYDVDAGDAWTGVFDIQGLTRDGLKVDTLSLDGGGTIATGLGAPIGQFIGDMTYGAQGVVFDNPDLARAIGRDIGGTISLARREDEPMVLRQITLEGAGVSAQGNAIIKGPADRFWTRSNLHIQAADFGRFSGLAGQELGGAGSLDLSGDVLPLDGIIDLVLSADGRDLQAGISQIDPLMTGDSQVSAHLERDTDGTRLRNVSLNSDALALRGRGEITSGTLNASLTGRLFDLGRIEPALSGPAEIDVTIDTDVDGVIALNGSATAPSASASAIASATPNGDSYDITGEVQTTLTSLAPYADLVGQQIAGGLTATARGQYATATGIFAADIDAQTRDLEVGPAGLSPVLRGLGAVQARINREAGGRLRLTGIQARFPNLSADGAVVVEAAQTRADLSLQLRDVGLFTPDFSGPVTAEVQAVQDTAGWQVSGDATGPANTSATVTGRVGTDGDLALLLRGDAPLGLANVYIAPRQLSGLAQFDLSINGAAALSSVSGPITISDARLTAPTFGQAVENITGTVSLSAAEARLDLSGNAAAGGQVTLGGPIALSPPFQANLAARLNTVTFREPTLYQTTATGQIDIIGPLAGGAAVSGTIDLGDAEIQVPSTSVSALGTLPQVTHLGARADVQRTLDRAGVGPVTQTTSDTQARPYPLDLLIRAPSRIFIRGRGLDAELGGELRITGTSDTVVPIGRFELVRGRLDILGQRFDLDEGYVQLQGDFIPYLRLVATTDTSSGTTVSIVIEGPADDPTVTFESSPELPQDEVLSQLLFGRSLSDISPLQAVELASAIATLAGNGGGGFLGDIRQSLDLDDLDLTTDEDGNAAVRAGKYISDNVYTDITVGSDGTSEINLNLDVSDDLTARGSVASDGETSLGIFFERDY